MNEAIIKKSILRVSEVFNVPVKAIKPSDRFGFELDVTSSAFSENELDDITSDVFYVADENVTEELDAGKRKINTVEDYCNHMLYCYDVNPERVKKVLEMLPFDDKKE